MLAQCFRGERGVAGVLQERGRADGADKGRRFSGSALYGDAEAGRLCRHAGRVRYPDGGLDFECCACAPGHAQIDLARAPWFDAAGEGLPQAFVQFRVVGFPDAIAGFQRGKIDVAVLEEEALSFDLKDAAALFRVGVAASIEDHAIARLERR